MAEQVSAFGAERIDERVDPAQRLVGSTEGRVGEGQLEIEPDEKCRM